MLDLAVIAFWLTVVGTVCWGICFWWMWRISRDQNRIMTRIQEQGERIERLSKIEHDLIKEVHPDVGAIKEGMQEVIAAVRETANPEAAPAPAPSIPSGAAKPRWFSRRSR